MKRNRSRPRSMTSPWRSSCRVTSFAFTRMPFLLSMSSTATPLGRGHEARVQPAQEAVVDVNVGEVGAAERHRLP